MVDQHRNMAVVGTMINAVNQRDMSALQELIRPDFQRHDLAGALPDVAGAEAAGDLIQLVLRAVPDMHIDVRRLIADQEYVTAHIVITGTHQGELFGVDGTGQRVEFHGINIYRMEDAKLAETWQLADVWGLLQQIGSVPRGE